MHSDQTHDNICFAASGTKPRSTTAEQYIDQPVKIKMGGLPLHEERVCNYVNSQNSHMMPIQEMRL